MATHNSVIVFNNQHFDTGNNYNTSNGRFTAPVAGRYYFGVQIYAGFGSEYVRVLHAQFQKNGGSTLQQQICLVVLQIMVELLTTQQDVDI